MDDHNSEGLSFWLTSQSFHNFRVYSEKNACFSGTKMWKYLDYRSLNVNVILDMPALKFRSRILEPTEYLRMMGVFDSIEL